MLFYAAYTSYVDNRRIFTTSECVDVYPRDFSYIDVLGMERKFQASFFFFSSHLVMW